MKEYYTIKPEYIDQFGENYTPDYRMDEEEISDLASELGTTEEAVKEMLDCHTSYQVMQECYISGSLVLACDKPYYDGDSLADAKKVFDRLDGPIILMSGEEIIEEKL